MQLKPSLVKFRLFCSKRPKYLHMAFQVYSQNINPHLFVFHFFSRQNIRESSHHLLHHERNKMHHWKFFVSVNKGANAKLKVFSHYWISLYCCLPETTFFLQSYSFTKLVSISPGLITFPRRNCWQHNKILSYALQILKYWACGAKVVQSYTVE